jgi:hypothetical protein
MNRLVSSPGHLCMSGQHLLAWQLAVAKCSYRKALQTRLMKTALIQSSNRGSQGWGLKSDEPQSIIPVPDQSHRGSRMESSL